MDKLLFEELNGGIALDTINQALEEVVDDMKNPAKNSDKRTVTVTMTFKPDKARVFSETSVKCNVKLAPYELAPDNVTLVK